LNLGKTMSSQWISFKWIMVCFLISIFPFFVAQKSTRTRYSDHVSVIGSGFSGLASACYLRQMGYNVTVFEKNSKAGGRAAKYEKDGFNFDIGPSWLWMPDVFDEFFANFGYEPKYTLKRLDPSYSVYWDRTNASQYTVLDDEISKRIDLFEKLEPGSSSKVEQFLEESKWKYEVGMGEYVRRPGLSFLEMWDVPFRAPSLGWGFWYSQREYVSRFVDHPWLRTLLEWPVLFLGGSPADIPSLYSLMSWADWGMGTYYPMPGGMYAIVDALYDLALGLGVEFEFESEVTGFDISLDGRITSIKVGSKQVKTSAVVNSADYNFVEQNLLPLEYRRYEPDMWDRQTFAPSVLLYFLGFDRKLPNLEHHTFFFHDGMDLHLDQVYNDHKWPDDPVFYVNVPSITDPEVAPADGESMFILIPVSPNLFGTDSEEIRDHYLEFVLNRISGIIDVDLHSHLVMNASFAHSDFMQHYHAYKGNSFGLANTLFQTWVLKPSMQSLVKNLVFVGQLTAPGPGVPPSLISGRLGADIIDQYFQGAETSFLQLILTATIATSLIFILLSRMIQRAYSLDECYEICRKLHMSHGLSYYISTLLLPNHLQKHVFALYGLTRTADEIVDSMTSKPEEMTRDLNRFRDDFFEAFDSAHDGSGKQAKHPVNRAAVATAMKLNLKREMFERFFKSMEMDIQQPLYMKTMSDTMTYMDGSAAVIGELMLPVLVGEDFYVHPENYPEHAELIQTARALGNAFQLTNFCRDVDEDLDRQRVYIPLDLLNQYGVSLESLEKRVMTPELEKALEHCLKICDGWYVEANKGIQLLAKYSEVCSSCIAASHTLYSGISNEIRKSNYAIFTKRCRVPMKEKLKILRPWLSCSMLPQIMEVLTHHIYIRLMKAPPIAPPPINF